MRILICLVSLVLISCAHQTFVDEQLPPIGDADGIVVKYQGKEVKTINDPVVVQKLRELVNEYETGWEVPWTGPPVASATLDFYLGKEHVAHFGFGPEFISRTYGNFWSRSVTAAEIERLRIAAQLWATDIK